MKNFDRIIRKFKSSSVLVIGDVMLDEYIWGRVDRISPEAPVQVVSVEKLTHVPGGAANVANNVAALSGSAFILGVVGRDPEREILKQEMENRGVRPILIEEDRPTIRKVRVMGQSQQLLRIDYEKKSHIEEKTESRIISAIQEVLPGAGCVVVSDYGKGIVTASLMKRLITLVSGAGKKIIVDPKPRNMKHFKEVFLVTPNHKEASAFTGIEEESEEDLKKIGRKIVQQLNANCLITRGEKGMSLFQKQGPATHIPTTARQVYDVTGAGDTVIATVALCLAAGATLPDAAAIANYAAGIVVGKVGTATLTTDELKSLLPT
jgi:D-beta-D-heptose 7-phosphate kinase/D-beta-D-heptose 1-phosphate adenosyltransferase